VSRHRVTRSLMETETFTQVKLARRSTPALRCLASSRGHTTTRYDVCSRKLADLGQNVYSNIDYSYLCQPMLGCGGTIHGYPDLSTSYVYLCNHMLPMLAYVLIDLHVSKSICRFGNTHFICLFKIHNIVLPNDKDKWSTDI
jgi:hypothetical protein